MNRIIYIFLGIIKSSYFQPIYDFLFKILCYLRNQIGSCDGLLSGESYAVDLFFKKIKANEKLIVFDVGANTGDFATMIYSKNIEKNLYLHCFEPISEAFNILKKKLSKKEDIYFINNALGNKIEEGTMYQAGDSRLSSTIARGDHNETIKRVTININTIDNYCKNQGINTINYLKIDVEGGEYQVLEGGKNMIDTGNIEYIQFEYGATALYSRKIFLDYWELLSTQYNIFRILPMGLRKIENYSRYEEVFGYSNYLCILKKLDEE